MFSISFNRLENCNPNHGTCPNSELLETVSDFVIDGKVSLINDPYIFTLQNPLNFLRIYMIPLK